MLPLDLLSEGEDGEIVAHRGLTGAGADGRAEDMGLRVGNRVRVLRNGTGPLLVKVDGSRIALDPQHRHAHPGPEGGAVTLSELKPGRLPRGGGTSSPPSASLP